MTGQGHHWRTGTRERHSRQAEAPALFPKSFTVSWRRRTALTLCFDLIPKGKRCALFPGKTAHTFPGIA
ncbi:hypothetical protein FJ546_13645 [Mesorhizobium sp. B2-4-19]|nr:hypothetical protein FJ546_13645 [Mesorhizobium sp. B2-4-19]